ncbi:MAG: hypothetical protein QXR57_07845 [Metallosphaera sp.]|uniref:hypothetical protein n=1 Tax=Metallosphaera sp. TaxID=2020860 RepID=UPI0031629F3E
MNAKLVSFEDGKAFLLYEDGTIKIAEQCLDPEVVIVRELTTEKIREYSGRGIKIFPCVQDEEQCLSIVLNKIFPQCKSCKFS